MEIKVDTNTLERVQKAVKNKKISAEELDSIQQAMAADHTLSPEEQQLLTAIKDHLDVTLTDGKKSTKINLTHVDLGFVDDAINIPPTGPVRLEQQKLVEDLPKVPSSAEFANQLKQNPKQTINDIQALWKHPALRGEVFDHIKQLAIEEQILLAKASLKDPLPHKLQQKLLRLLQKDKPLTTLLHSNQPASYEVLAKMLEQSSGSHRSVMLALLMDPPRWDKPGKAITSKYNSYKPTLSQQLQLFEALMKTKDVAFRTELLKQAHEWTERIDLMRGYSKEDPTGMDVDVSDRMGGMGIYERAHRWHYQQRVDEIKAGKKPPKSITDTIYPHAWEYARRAEILDDYFGVYPSQGLEKQFQKSLQAAIGDGLATDPVQLVDYLRENSDKFSHEDLSGLITLMLNPPNPEASLGFYRVLEQTVADVTNTTLSPEKRKNAAYALGKYLGAAAAVAERLPEPSRGMLFYVLSLGLDQLPIVGKLTSYKQKLPGVPGAAKTFLLDKLDAVFNGKEREAVKKARQAIFDMVDGVHESIMRVDAKENQSDFEQEYIAGRSFYQQTNYRLGKGS